MKRRILKQICHEISRELGQKPYSHWSQANFPIVYTEERKGCALTVEIVLLEDEKDYMHIAVNVDAGGLIDSFAPAGDSFIIKKA